MISTAVLVSCSAAMVVTRAEHNHHHRSDALRRGSIQHHETQRRRLARFGFYINEVRKPPSGMRLPSLHHADWSLAKNSAAAATVVGHACHAGRPAMTAARAGQLRVGEFVRFAAVSPSISEGIVRQPKSIDG